MHSFCAKNEAVQLQQLELAKDDTDPKALACYGLLLRHKQQQDSLHLRFVVGRPLSSLTIQFLEWCSSRLQEAGKRVLLLVWDNATWHRSKVVDNWVHEHNRKVKANEKVGVRLLVCFLPSRSPWLNPIEPKWVHGKRRVHEPQRLLSANELEERVYAAFGCDPQSRLVNSA